MKQTLFNITEMYELGLSIGEVLDIIGRAYEAEVARALSNEYLIAQTRVADGTYTQKDLDVLKARLVEKEPEKELKPKKASATPTILTLEELQEIIKAMDDITF